MTTTMDITDRLNALISKGYKFVHPRDEDGEVVAVVGVRVHHEVVDLVRVHGEDDVIATRAPADEHDVLHPDTVLWEYRGAADDVIDTMLELPDPQPGKRQDVHRLSPGCWVGDDRGRSRWLTASA